MSTVPAFSPVADPSPPLTFLPASTRARVGSYRRDSRTLGKVHTKHHLLLAARPNPAFLCFSLSLAIWRALSSMRNKVFGLNVRERCGALCIWSACVRQHHWLLLCAWASVLLHTNVAESDSERDRSTVMMLAATPQMARGWAVCRMLLYRCFTNEYVSSQ